MSSLKRYGDIVAVAICALFAVAALLAICLFVYAAWLHPDSSSAHPATAGFFGLMVFIYAVTIGMLMVISVGAPLYLLLERLGIANWPMVLLVGVAPGLALFSLANFLGYWPIALGAAVAAITHSYLVRAARIRLA